MTALITNASPDILYKIFEFTLPTALSDPIKTRVAAADFFSRTSPYNLALTSRDWRNFVLSSHSLWSSIFLSFDLPSSEDTIVLHDALERHLKRSGEALVTCSVVLSSRYNETSAYQIKCCLLKRRRRWKQISIYVNPWRSREILLAVKDMEILYEPRPAERNTDEGSDIYLPSLTHLEVEVRSLRSALEWMKLAPNLQKFFLLYISPWSRSEHHLSVISLPALRRLGMDSYFPTQREEDSVGTASTILTHITSRALTELRIQLHGVNCDEALQNFLRQSTPPLEILALRVLNYRREDNAQREKVLIQAFTLVPSVRNLRIEWFYFPEAIFQALSRSKTIFPALEDLELSEIVMPVEHFLDVVTSQWRSEHRTLKVITLTGCSSNPLHHHLSFRQRFQEFAPGDDPFELPDTLAKLREFISEGLKYSARQYVN
ncbi:hypothetical protein SCHPADRAFT_910790 [Schizopora paradoxa]|uniref:F-box domain-containing protein n=1 Tax=Schizopora paradoxa TaxID=27342 RepID=A0A0H2R1Z9_9AGAM|nr:hypothetical protein SCHPADRAFT_910790 [Schizopora paradoxa]